MNEKQLAIIKAKLQKLTISDTDYDETSKFSVIMTDETIDRHGEVLKADGMDYSNFMKNPVILCDHRYTIDSIIGKATSIFYDKENKQWICEGVFSKTNPKGQLANDLYNEGMLKTVSVGLIPSYDPKNSNIILNWELLELSFIPVPANPNAVSTDNKELVIKGIEAGLLKEQEQEEKQEDDDIKESIKEIKNDIAIIKTKIMVDDNTNDQNDYTGKEALQEVARTVNEALRMIKEKYAK